MSEMCDAHVLWCMPLLSMCRHKDRFVTLSEAQPHIPEEEPEDLLQSTEDEVTAAYCLLLLLAHPGPFPEQGVGVPSCTLPLFLPHCPPRPMPPPWPMHAQSEGGALVVTIGDTFYRRAKNWGRIAVYCMADSFHRDAVEQQLHQELPACDYRYGGGQVLAGKAPTKRG